MQTSTRLVIPHPDGTDPVDIDGDLADIVAALEANAAGYGQGTITNRPVSTPGSPGKAGRIYIVTSTADGGIVGALYYDYGTGWYYTNPDQTVADNAITLAKMADNSVGTSEIIDGSVGSAEIADGSVAAAEIADALKPSSGAGAGVEALRAIGMGVTLAMSQSQIASINQIGPLSGRPAANAVVAGTKYFASDQVVEYISDGANWFRLSLPAGVTVSWYKPDAAAPTGWVKYNGQVLATGGINADIITHLGTSTTPDTSGRQEVGQGTHADVDAIGDNDGIATVANRRPKHKHTVVQPTVSSPSINVVQPTISAPTINHTGSIDGTGGGGASNLVGGSGGTSTEPTFSATAPVATNGTATLASAPIATAGTVGPQTGAEPTDGSAWITTLKIAKL